MSNNFEVCASNNDMKDFIKSSINTSDEVIKHYDFVINDISSEISDVSLETTKAPTIAFLKKMRTNWVNFKSDLESKLCALERENNG